MRCSQQTELVKTGLNCDGSGHLQNGKLAQRKVPGKMMHHKWRILLLVLLHTGLLLVMQKGI